MNILADASLPGLIEAFPEPFKLTLYKHHEEIRGLLKNQDILLCRAQLKVDESLLTHHALSIVATASSGSDNLDKPYLKSKGITALDAKGCNAVAVADYVVSSIAYLAQNQILQGTKVGIIGLGHVGSEVYKRLKAADFELFCYDPPRATGDPHFKSDTKENLYQCDLLCIHSELHNLPPYSSVNLIDEHFLNQLKPGCIIINAARGGIVDEEALLNLKNPIVYCTDVYLNEPQINRQIIEKSTLCTPHIAGHSLEAKYSAVAVISRKIHEHLGWKPPIYAVPSATPSSRNTHSWQELALALYNPITDTHLLQQATNLKAAFIELRTAHTYRHNFNTCIDPCAQNKTKQILGA
jgi:erythronate-4-phosphate dehydrogenase